MAVKDGREAGRRVDLVCEISVDEAHWMEIKTGRKGRGRMKRVDPEKSELFFDRLSEELVSGNHSTLDLGLVRVFL